jgi:hypothetical protein
MQSELKGQRLILHIHRDSCLTIKRTGYKIIARLSQETVNILKDPEAQYRNEKELCQTQRPQNRSLREREMEQPFPQMTREVQQM